MVDCAYCKKEVLEADAVLNVTGMNVFHRVCYRTGKVRNQIHLTVEADELLRSHCLHYGEVSSTIEKLIREKWGSGEVHS